ncbi:MAG: hypothetical protein IJ832_01740 [Bacteroidaceae bacterium]|nr:hypothetical protein [Bacteroidaceae bacterium]
MFEFDLETTLEEMKDLSLQEKIKQLDSLYDEIQDAAQEVFDRMCELSEEHEASTLKTVTEEMKSFITEMHKEEYVTILKDVFIVKSNQFQVEIRVFNIEDDWRLLIRTSHHIANNEKRYDKLSSLAQLLELPYKRGDDQIKIEVNEERLLPALKSIVTKLCTC